MKTASRVAICIAARAQALKTSPWHVRCESVDPKRMSFQSTRAVGADLGLSAEVDESETSSHSTLPPPFDLEEFARRRMADGRERVAPSDRPTEPAPADPAAPAFAKAARSLHARGVEQVRADLAEKFFAADYDSALTLAEELAGLDASDAMVAVFADECRRMLERTYAGRFGTLGCTPRLAAPLHEFRNLALDHQAGFLLSCVDGATTLEVVLDLCAMPRLEALRLVAKLVDYGVLLLMPGPGASEHGGAKTGS
jgi:hypothetical protein